MTFIGAIKNGFNKYATFRGRASRSEYWYWTLFVTILTICTSIFDLAAFPNSLFSPLNSIFAIITLLPGIAVVVRRLHDVNRSGWWFWLVFTVIGLIPMFYWLVKASDEGENSHGLLE